MICFRFLIPLINPLSLIIAFLSRLFFVPDPARFRLRATLLAADARAVVPPGNSIPAVFCVLVRREQWTEGDRFTRYRASYAKCKRGNGLLVTMITSGRYFFFFFWRRDDWVSRGMNFFLDYDFRTSYVFEMVKDNYWEYFDNSLSPFTWISSLENIEKSYIKFL